MTSITAENVRFYFGECCLSCVRAVGKFVHWTIEVWTKFKSSQFVESFSSSIQNILQKIENLFLTKNSSYSGLPEFLRNHMDGHRAFSQIPVRDEVPNSYYFDRYLTQIAPDEKIEHRQPKEPGLKSLPFNINDLPENIWEIPFVSRREGSREKRLDLEAYALKIETLYRKNFPDQAERVNDAIESAMDLTLPIRLILISLVLSDPDTHPLQTENIPPIIREIQSTIRNELRPGCSDISKNELLMSSFSLDVYQKILTHDDRQFLRNLSIDDELDVPADYNPVHNYAANFEEILQNNGQDLQSVSPEMRRFVVWKVIKNIAGKMNAPNYFKIVEDLYREMSTYDRSIPEGD